MPDCKHAFSRRMAVNYFNDMNTLLQDMIEIADIPDIAVAGIDDIEDAYAGLKIRWNG